MIVRLSVQGCDDSTVFNWDVSESELAFLKRLCDKVCEESAYGCQPRMFIVEPKEHRTMDYEDFDDD